MLFVPLPGWPDAVRINAGDSVEKVYKALGTPTLEFPLNGELIQQYEQCTVVSRDGIVISAAYQQAEAETDEESAEKPSAPSVRDVMIKAEDGDPEAQYLLAYSFQLGQAVEQDYAKAVEWYTRAARQGHMPAQHNLGVLYMNGEGIEQDDVEAYAWALLAADNGNGSLVSVLRHRLSPEQRKAGELRARGIRSGSGSE